MAASPNWQAPEARREGAWGFDLFTPPVIYYHRQTGRFSVTPPEVKEATASSVAQKAFGVTLVGVTREPYRLQLMGYAGNEDDYLGIFQNEITGEAIVARAGHRFPDLGLEVSKLDVRREDLIVPDSMPLRDIVAVAEVWDTEAGWVTRLSSAGWQGNDTPWADLRDDASGKVHRLRAGDSVEADGVVFQIRSVGGLPESVTIGKKYPDGTQELMTWRPTSRPMAEIEGDPTYFPC